METGVTAQGDPDNQGESTFEAVYDQLRRLAGAHFRLQPDGHTLQPTALVHEVYVKLASGEDGADRAENAEHLLALASRAMRHVLVDHARGKKALKRGGAGLDAPSPTPANERVTLAGVDDTSAQWDVLDLNDALERLEQLDERQARIVELRFFGGLSVERTAEVLEVSERTVYLDWQMARAWLRTEFATGPDE